MTSTLNTLVENIITCPICLKHFDEPRDLSCRDTYCLQCIQQMATDNQGTMQCLRPDGGRVAANEIIQLDPNESIVKLMKAFGK